MRASVLVLALSVAACATDRPAELAEPATMTIDALDWERTPSESRLYLDAHLAECRSAEELKAVTSAADRRFELIADDARVIELSCGTGGRTIVRDGRTSCSLMLFPSRAGWRPQPGVRYRLTPHNSSGEHRWVVADGLETPVYAE